MATIMLMHWREASSDQYDQVRAKAQWDRDVPDGAKLHVCGFSDDGMQHYADISMGDWERDGEITRPRCGLRRPERGFVRPAPYRLARLCSQTAFPDARVVMIRAVEGSDSVMTEGALLKHARRPTR